jgi:hypothetical protein
VKPIGERLSKYPVRLCRTMHHCILCGERIDAGDRYHDGGYSHRAHVTCVEAQVRAAREEQRS